uniref:Uncharacterized protein n=1 Tax=Loa loa TaxID=7209 RepID=A0A1I7VWK1_LOALO
MVESSRVALLRFSNLKSCFLNISLHGYEGIKALETMEGDTGCRNPTLFLIIIDFLAKYITGMLARNALFLPETQCHLFCMRIDAFLIALGDVIPSAPLIHLSQTTDQPVVPTLSNKILRHSPASPLYLLIHPSIHHALSRSAAGHAASLVIVALSMHACIYIQNMSTFGMNRVKNKLLQGC